MFGSRIRRQRINRVAAQVLLMLTVLGFNLPAPPAQAALAYYDAANGRVHLIGYPERLPATPALLLKLDRLHGWEIMRHSPEEDRYELDADLIIGFNNGSKTFFQAGGSRAPGETLLVRGNVVVYPCHIEGENRSLQPRETPPGRNRLILGEEDEARSGATLLIASGPGDEGRTLHAGHVPRRQDYPGGSGPGGEVHVYHSRIAAANPGPEGRLGLPGPRSGGSPGLRLGRDPVLVHAVLENADGYFLASVGREARIEQVVCIDGQSGLYNFSSPQPVFGSTFRNLDTAVRDGGSLNVMLVDCIFENNDRHWTMTHTACGLTLRDCTWDEPRDGNIYRAWDNPRTGERQYPFVLSERHVIIKVTDAAGNPVPGAGLRIENEQEVWDAAEPPRLRTGPDGRTPGRGQPGALRLREFLHRATDTENEPEITNYSYTITVTAEGFAPKIRKGYRPSTSWDIVVLVLE